MTHYENSSATNKVEVFSAMYQAENGSFQKNICIRAINEFGCFFQTEETFEVCESNMKAIAATIAAYKERAMQIADSSEIAKQLFQNCSRRGFDVIL